MIRKMSHTSNPEIFCYVVAPHELTRPQPIMANSKTLDPPVPQHITDTANPPRSVDNDIKNYSQQQVADLVDKRDRVQVFQGTQAALDITPIQRVPVELIASIFELCLPEWEWSSPRYALALGQLMQTCREWRTIAISTAKLWRFINVNLNYGGFVSQTALVTTWLARSGCYPLSVRLECHTYKAAGHPAVNAIIQHSHRWQSLCIISVGGFYDRLSSAKGHLDKLQTLFFDHLCYINIDTFSIAPHLRDVTLNGDVDPVNVILPWQQITRCKLESMNGDWCLEVLPQMRHLWLTATSDILEILIYPLPLCRPFNR